MSIKATIYKITCKDPEIKGCYVGSTKNFAVRKYLHKQTFNNPKSKEYNFKKNVFFRENGGFENFNMEVIRERVFNDKKEMREEEQLFINQLGANLNDKRAILTTEDIEADKIKNKGRRRIEWQKYYSKNKEIIVEKRRKWREDNREQHNEYNRLYREKNKERRNEKINCEKCEKVLSRNSMSKHRRFYCEKISPVVN